MIAEEIRSERLTLRCLAEGDATERYLKWMTDGQVNQFLESRFADQSIESLRSYIRDMRRSSDSYLFGIFGTDTGAHYGNIKLGPISSEHKHAAVGLILGDKEVWGQGFATEAITAITGWARNTLRLEKLFAGAYASNVGSIRAFERNGYSVEGVQRSHVRLETGERDDVVILGVVLP